MQIRGLIFEGITLDLDESIDRARQLSDGPQKVAILEQVVRYCDAIGDSRRAFDVRYELVEAASNAGLHEQSLVAFVAFLNYFDRTPDVHDRLDELLWAYFGIIWFTVDQPAISLEQIDQMVDDLRQRFARLGLKDRPVDHLRWRLDMANGFLDRAYEVQKRWSQSRTTQYCYDRACQLDSVVELHFRAGRYRDAIDAAQPIFDQNLRSDPVPGLTYSNVMISHALLGDHDLASYYAEKLTQYLKGRHSLGYLYEVSFLLTYFVHSRQIERALKLFRQYIRWTSETRDKDNINLFLNAAAELLRIVSADKRSIKLRWDGAFPWCKGHDKYEVAELASQIDAWLAPSIAAFDLRNRNTVYSERLRLFRSICQTSPASSG